MNEILFTELIAQNIASSKTIASIEITKTTKVTFDNNSLFQEETLISNDDWPLLIPLKEFSKDSNQEFNNKIEQQAKILTEQQFIQNGPNSSFNTAIDYWQEQWDNVKYCFDNKLPMLTIGNIQSQKTVYYLALTYLALNGFTKNEVIELPLVNTVWLTTNNDNGSEDQNEKRAKDILGPYGVPIFKVKPNDLKKNPDDFLQSGCYISISNSTRSGLLDQYISNTIKVKKQQESKGFDYQSPRILILLDEGDLNFPEMGGKELETDSVITEKKLYDAAWRTDCLVRYMSISATMTSTIALYRNFYGRLPELKNEQVFTPPINNLYKGLVNPDGSYNSDFIDEKTFLSYEDPKYFSKGKYTSSASIANVQNPNIIAIAMINHDNQQQSLNGKKLTQIATVTLAKRKDQHTRAGELIVDAFNFRGQKAELIDSHDVKVDSISEWVVITHNGDTDTLSAAEKIEKIYIAKHNCGIDLKGIMFVGGHLLGRAVTYEIPNRHDPRQPQYGSYCNISFTLPSIDKPNIESLVQTFRCAGVRPDTKTHKVYTSKSISESVKEYCNILSDMITNIRQKGTLEQGQLFSYISRIQKTDGKMTVPVISTSRKEKHIPKAGGGKRLRIDEDVDQFQRNIYLQIGLLIANQTHSVLSGDDYWRISKSEYESLINGKNLKISGEDFLRSKGKNITLSQTLRQANHFKDTVAESGRLSTAEDARRQLMYGKQTDNLASIWKTSNDEYYFYIKYGQTGSNYVIRYKLELDHNGTPHSLDRPGQRSIIDSPNTNDRVLLT